MPPVRHVVYLHGFCSSPQSSKARRFAKELAGRRVGFSCPDFNEPSFETLTVTRMLEQTQAAIDAVPEGPIALVGSSLGAFVAVHAAARDRAHRVDRLVLLAPAFDFGGNRLRQLGEHGVAAWRAAGSLRVFHYGFEAFRTVGFGLYEDAAHYDAFGLEDSRPMLIIQGRRDDTVDPKMVAQWAALRPSVTLLMLDDDHQLTASIDRVWRESERWLGLA